VVLTFAVAGALALVSTGASRNGTASKPASNPDVFTFDFKLMSGSPIEFDVLVRLIIGLRLVWN
jgi:hypothetical protein